MDQRAEGVFGTLDRCVSENLQESGMLGGSRYPSGSLENLVNVRIRGPPVALLRGARCDQESEDRPRGCAIANGVASLSV